jgi:type I restriction enzyme R subunit
MPTEADTCRTFVVPKLQAAGCDDEPHSIAEQRTITDGRIVPVGQGFVRKSAKRVDYLLRYSRDFPLAVVEAKARYKTAAEGMQQLKQYAEMLGLTFAYATNGHDILEFDYSTGLETSRVDYPTPGELWQRYRAASGLHDQQAADRLLTPCHSTVGRSERYYQHLAINRAVEAILKGQPRLLLTMATGTGKTLVACQICWKLWTARWNRTGAYRRPKILHLADRNLLVDQPKDGIFTAFGDARYKIESGEDERRIGLFKAFPADFFDLVIRHFQYLSRSIVPRSVL